MGLVLIVAPHPDDEVIGCWSVIRDFMGSHSHDLVIACVNPESEERKREFMNVVKIIGCDGLIGLDEALSIAKDADVVFVPHPLDNHPHHKWVTTSFQMSGISGKLRYYSTEMNVWWALKSLEDWKDKMRFLIEHYPSQKEEFMANRHWLHFEAITEHPSPPLIEVSLSFLGYHNWVNAPLKRRYLSFRHQHVFTVIVRALAFGLDRELEFHDLRDKVWSIIQVNSGRWDLNGYSVEAMARDIYYKLKSKGIKWVKVGVCEEGNLCGWYGDPI